MEILKSAVPDALKLEISNSTPAQLPSTSSSLLHFFHHSPLFHQMIKDLTDPSVALCCKDRSAALEAKLKGNECFSKGDYPNALLFYSQAVRLAPVDMDDVEINMVALLYVNRASTLQKMGLLLECLRDCSRALRVSPRYAKAWFRRGKANISLGKFVDAIRDLNISLKVEISSSGKRQIEAELMIALDKFKGMGSSGKKINENQSEDRDEPDQVKLQCVSTTTKGRGVFCVDDVSEASLVHKEDPYAAIILKKYRETHCHFCFNELPADVISYDLKNYMADVRAGTSTLDTVHIAEHSHECQGFHWPLILPSEVVLAGRILVKVIEQKRRTSADSNLIEFLDLSHNYLQLPPESKLGMHIYSIILLHCLQHLYRTELPISGIMVSKLVILLSQIQVNSMAVVRMQAPEVKGPVHEPGNALTSSLEQVKVGQAVYVAGSLFNHSCQPNIHAYFLSRTLYVQSTEYIIAGTELELSYGPQVGQWDCKDRQRLLEDRYSFTCQCTGCSELNVPDLVINAYRCTKLNCLGVILDRTVAGCEKRKLKLLPDASTVYCSSPHKKVEKLNDANISEVARHVLESDYKLEPQHCLVCDSYRDLEASCAAASQADSCYKRLQDAIALNEVQSNVLLDAVRCTDLLRTVFHPYNKRIAEMEDHLAQAFYLVGELQAAIDHCKASIQILEKLYDANHIAIGNELIKLASLQILMGNSAASNSISRITAIFSRYYGSHADDIYPYLRLLKGSQDADKSPI
ncbi:N-lysine methyltransferase SMYD2 isoform X3 [Capsicum annuum]|uniref:N-lysine methyltransferase SMYD2 isoform X3 n=1 Tax=Capsicum annuum TaxID=4072 RepID=UPI001FB1636C|nr:N-lysine methyltransferase SMYD2 isoform X3 [Capsicum annuum]